MILELIVFSLFSVFVLTILLAILIEILQTAFKEVEKIMGKIKKHLIRGCL